jgi:hypothetical protein
MNAFPLEEGKRGTLNTAILCDTSMDSVQWICAMFKLFISQIPMLCISSTYAFTIGLENERKFEL